MFTLRSLIPDTYALLLSAPQDLGERVMAIV